MITTEESARIIVSKILASIMQRLTRVREERIRVNEASFRPGRGCVDQIFTLDQVLKHLPTDLQLQVFFSSLCQHLNP